MASGADTLKRLTLELGGNDAAIVLDDARSGGRRAEDLHGRDVQLRQICARSSACMWPRSCTTPCAPSLRKLANAAVVGDGMLPTTTMGPIQNRMQFEKVKEYLADANARGKVIAGGRAVDGPGYFIQPTIVRDIPDDARLVREEQFWAGAADPEIQQHRRRHRSRQRQRIRTLRQRLGSRFHACGSTWPARSISARAGEQDPRHQPEVLVPGRQAVRHQAPSSGHQGLEEHTQAKVIRHRGRLRVGRRGRWARESVGVVSRPGQSRANLGAGRRVRASRLSLERQSSPAGRLAFYREVRQRGGAPTGGASRFRIAVRWTSIRQHARGVHPAGCLATRASGQLLPRE